MRIIRELILKRALRHANRKADALQAVIDTMNYLSGQSEVETNIRMILDHHKIKHLPKA